MLRQLYDYTELVAEPELELQVQWAAGHLPLRKHV